MKKRISSIFIIVLLLIPSLSHARKKSDSYDALKPLMEVYAIIQDTYVDEEKTDPDELAEEAIKGMVKHLDPFSQYLDKQSYKDMTEDTKAEFGGLGIEISVRDEQLTVVSPIEDTPAFNAGIKAGDKIMQIEGESTDGIEIMDAVHKLRGEPGTEVTITIQRGHNPEWFDVTIKRDIIKIKTARFSIVGDDVGYIRINEFMGKADDVVEKALEDFKKKKIKKLILDLRNNPGGLLDQSVKVSDFFLDKDTLIVSTSGRDKSKKVEFKAKKGKEFKGDMVVLINGGSASASEIVSGALQDNKRAVIVGTQSFGKGSVQTIIPLSDNSALRLTTAQYFTPSGAKIHGVGIKPDIELEEPVPSSYTVGLSDKGLITDFAADYMKKHPEGISSKKKKSVNVSESDIKVLFRKGSDDELMEEFTKWLKKKDAAEIQPQELAGDREIILKWLKTEIERKHTGRSAARKASIENDTQVRRAVNILDTMSKFEK